MHLQSTCRAINICGDRQSQTLQECFLSFESLGMVNDLKADVTVVLTKKCGSRGDGIGFDNEGVDSCEFEKSGAFE